MLAQISDPHIKEMAASPRVFWNSLMFSPPSLPGYPISMILAQFIVN